MQAIDLRFQALNADALIRVLAYIDLVHFLVNAFPSRIKTHSTLFLIVAVLMRIPTICALIAHKFLKTKEKLLSTFLNCWVPI